MNEIDWQMLYHHAFERAVEAEAKLLVLKEALEKIAMLDHPADKIAREALNQVLRK